MADNTVETPDISDEDRAVLAAITPAQRASLVEANKQKIRTAEANDPNRIITMREAQDIARRQVDAAITNQKYREQYSSTVATAARAVRPDIDAGGLALLEKLALDRAQDPEIAKLTPDQWLRKIGELTALEIADQEKRWGRGTIKSSEEQAREDHGQTGTGRSSAPTGQSSASTKSAVYDPVSNPEITPFTEYEDLQTIRDRTRQERQEYVKKQAIGA